MAIFIPSQGSSSGVMHKYCEDGERKEKALSPSEQRYEIHDSLGIYGNRLAREAEWSAIRNDWGKEKDDPGRKNIRYHHFAINLKDEDRLKFSDEKLADFSKDYVKELGLEGHEFTVWRHKDEDKRQDHLHIVVNSVNTETGKKIHFNRDENRQIITKGKAMCEKHGLAYIEHRQVETKSERAIKARGGISWKANLKDHIKGALNESSSVEEFKENLAGRGVRVEASKYKDGSPQFRYHIQHEDREVSQREYRILGIDATLKNIKERFEREAGYRQEPHYQDLKGLSETLNARHESYQKNPTDPGHGKELIEASNDFNQKARKIGLSSEEKAFHIRHLDKKQYFSDIERAKFISSSERCHSNRQLSKIIKNKKYQLDEKHGLTKKSQVSR